MNSRKNAQGRQGSGAAKKEKGKSEPYIWLLYALLIALIALYALYGAVLIGAAAVLLIIALVVLEVKASIANEGARKGLLDIGMAVGAAIVAWVLLAAFLQTTAPLDAVSSCSMLPTMHRGDLVVLHGISNFSSFVAQKHIPVVSMSAATFDAMQRNMSSEFLAYFAYYGNASRITYVLENSSAFNVGLYNTVCVSAADYYGRPSDIADCRVGGQAGLSIRYSYSLGNLSYENYLYKALYTSGINITGTSITENYSNPIIVYRATSDDAFSGDIVHRVYAALNVSGTYYFLTKGDNNQALDMEFGNYPVNQSDVVGYVVADVPALGYVKLLLSGQLATPAGCNTTLSAR